MSRFTAFTATASSAATMLRQALRPQAIAGEVLLEQGGRLAGSNSDPYGIDLFVR